MESDYFFMSINLKPHSLECGSSFGVLDFGSSRKPLNKPHTLVCGKLKVFLILGFFILILIIYFFYVENLENHTL